MVSLIFIFFKEMYIVFVHSSMVNNANVKGPLTNSPFEFFIYSLSVCGIILFSYYLANLWSLCWRLWSSCARAFNLIHCVKSARIRSFSGLCFPAFVVNTETYSVSLRIQFKCGKMGTRKAPNKDTFYVGVVLAESHSVVLENECAGVL